MPQCPSLSFRKRRRTFALKPISGAEKSPLENPRRLHADPRLTLTPMHLIVLHAPPRQPKSYFPQGNRVLFGRLDFPSFDQDARETVRQAALRIGADTWEFSLDRTWTRLSSEGPAHEVAIMAEARMKLMRWCRESLSSRQKCQRRER
jgi:hypothetical protein